MYSRTLRHISSQKHCYALHQQMRNLCFNRFKNAIVPSLAKIAIQVQAMHNTNTVLLIQLVDWEFEHILASQSLVHMREGIQLVLKSSGILLVQEDLDQFAAVCLDAGTTTNDLSWIDQILEDLVVHSSQSTAAWTLLLGTTLACWLRKDATLSNKDNMAVRELLLQLAGEALLNLMVLSQKWDWDKDNDGLFAVTKLDLPCKSIISIYSFTKHLTNMTIGDAFTSQALPDTLKLCTISGV
jgi:hypothetical protein